ncbi:glycoside hydrolase [Micromonospora terminaliae]|uniref:C40 family peptidase n=1 Tax=Micromonospora terminaliae TaxID=1914461 RepID=A0AAJ3DK77_9ACTN|nr:NlpC/P60 family protein [Micromonospora terminaliae]NES29401.1 C40 family peptidase [Micromonospora terminaliae]QGL48424.1 glycoside hydrolase [Micromonospora terminaliae]
MEVQPGREAVVRVPVATLWAAPEAVRPVDRPALGETPDVATWIAGMDRDQQVGDCVLTQLLLGERVLVTEVRADGWAQVVALGQPAAKLAVRGYPGWLPTAQLTAAAEPGPPGTPLVVDALHTALHAAPGSPPALTGVVLGTRLAPAGRPADGWRPVLAPGHAEPLWAPEGDLVPLPAERPEAKEVLALAERLRGLIYIWGGLSTDGIDCSGLVHLAWRRHGLTLPRDADDQAEATTPLALGEERPGDLYFFARPGRRIHHVGIVSSEPQGEVRRMLHACYVKRRVVEERLPPDREATLVGVHRI